MKEHSDSKSGSGDALHSGKHHGFKKKGKHRKMESSVNEFFKGVAFCTGKERPELNLKKIDQLGLDASTQFKNSSDVMKCLKNGKVIKPAVPELPNEHTAHEKIVLDYCMGELMKMERVLEGNLCNLFVLVMSLCDSDSKNQAESTVKCPDMEKKLDSMGLLEVIKKLIYTGGTINLNMRHDKAMA